MPRASERQARGELPRRLATVKQWLIDGVPPHQLHAYAAQLWNVTRRTTDKYLRKVGAEWAQAACAADYLSHLWLAKAQREQLIDRLHRQIGTATDPAIAGRLIDLCHKLLKERDALMAKLVQHRKETERDTSPSGEEMVVMTRKEFNERFENHVFIEEYYARQEEYAKEFGASSGIPRLAKYVRKPGPAPAAEEGGERKEEGGERKEEGGERSEERGRRSAEAAAPSLSPSPLAGDRSPSSPSPLEGERSHSSPSPLEGERSHSSPSPLEGEGWGGGWKTDQPTPGQTGTSAPESPPAKPPGGGNPTRQNRKPSRELDSMTASPRTSAKELARKFWGDRDDEDAELNLLPPASPGPPPRRPKPW